MALKELSFERVYGMTDGQLDGRSNISGSGGYHNVKLP